MDILYSIFCNQFFMLPILPNFVTIFTQFRHHFCPLFVSTFLLVILVSFLCLVVSHFSFPGTTLLFYPCDSRDGRAIESQPRHLIIIDGAIMQPIPEHPKRDFIFCLSTAFGDAYLFQAPCASGMY